MKELYTKTDFDIQIDRKEVFRIMDCYEDSPVYEMVEEEYEIWEPRAKELLEPCAVIAPGSCDRSYGRRDLQETDEAFFVIQSIGEGCSMESTRLFAQGDTLGGMLLDAMADAALNDLGRQVGKWLKDICEKGERGILRRLEAPYALPMEAQEWILEKTQGDVLGISVTSGYMFCPVKTTGYVLLTTTDTAIFRDQHNCRCCDRKDCKMRNIQPVKIVLEAEKSETLISEKEQTIMEVLAEQTGRYTFPCGGKGTCGKCRIRVLEGELPVTEWDRKFFTEEELADGMRLACQAYPTEDIVIQFLGEKGDSFEVLSATMDNGRSDECQTAPYVIAVDIGTTTLAVGLADSRTAKMKQVYTGVNRQRSLGLDVITRIQAACEGKGPELQRLVREDVSAGIRALLEAEGVKDDEVGQIAISGNTTMGHLLMGLSCETLGVAPFTPVDISMRELSYCEVFGSDAYRMPVCLLPGITTYVGADITAGMLTLGFDIKEEVSVLIDLGTNGEMAVGNCNRILVTSTAAGPAFEGGNISCGVGSIAGAVSDLTIEGTDVQLTTISDAPAVGICGTGVIAATAELLRNEWVDETGLLDEEYFEEGFVLGEDVHGNRIVFTQKDVREMQLAKAAVRAGLETLLVHYGIGYDAIDKVYLAGGFGYKMDLDKAVYIGLIPQQLRNKVEAVGNSSLAGARDALLQRDAKERMNRICGLATEVNLSTDKNFNDFYMEYMMFE